jgi:hypothetical protein
MRKNIQRCRHKFVPNLVISRKYDIPMPDYENQKCIYCGELRFLSAGKIKNEKK